MKLNNKKLIFFILILIWMILVFLFSSQNSYKSARISGGITHRIVSLFFNDSDKNMVDNIEHIVRKFAHFSMYFIGGMLFFNLSDLYEINLKNKILYSQIFGTFYAITDEFHQLFVPGRSGEIRDVILDSCGVLLGIALSCFFIVKIRVNQKFRKKNT